MPYNQTNQDDHPPEMRDVPVHLYYMRKDVNDIKKTLENGYVTKDEFDPIRRIVYGMVGLILSGVVAGLLTLIISN